MTAWASRTPWVLLIGVSAVLFAGAATAQSVEEGRKVFTEQASPSCAVCHTLSDVGSQGQIGPNLDELGPNVARVYKAVTGGVGVMPPYADSLSEEQRRAVAAYVADVTGGPSESK